MDPQMYLSAGSLFEDWLFSLARGDLDQQALLFRFVGRAPMTLDVGVGPRPLLRHPDISIHAA